MEAPTVDQITSWSKLPFAELDYDPEGLERLRARAVSDVQRWTGRQLATMPTEWEEAAREAVQRAMELKALQEQEDVLETLADFDLIQNFSVTGYSETRRSAEDAMKAKMIVSWPLLNELLWDLATPDRRDEWWVRWGVQAPAFDVTEVDWGYSTPPGVGLDYPGA